MIVAVCGNLDAALRILGRKMLADGIEKELKVRRFPKRSERIRFKLFLAERRRVRNQARNEGRRSRNTARGGVSP